MTPTELRALLAKATPGAWAPGYGRGSDTVFRIPSGAPDDDGEPVARCYAQDDVRAIAAMHAALPALLDVAEAAQRARECRHNDQYGGPCSTCFGALATALAKLGSK